MGYGDTRPTCVRAERLVVFRCTFKGKASPNSISGTSAGSHMTTDLNSFFRSHSISRGASFPMQQQLSMTHEQHESLQGMDTSGPTGDSQEQPPRPIKQNAVLPAPVHKQNGSGGYEHTPEADSLPMRTISAHPSYDDDGFLVDSDEGSSGKYLAEQASKAQALHSNDIVDRLSSPLSRPPIAPNSSTRHSPVPAPPASLAPVPVQVQPQIVPPAAPIIPSTTMYAKQSSSMLGPPQASLPVNRTTSRPSFNGVNDPNNAFAIAAATSGLRRQHELTPAQGAESDTSAHLRPGSPSGMSARSKVSGWLEGPGHEVSGGITHHGSDSVDRDALEAEPERPLSTSASNVNRLASGIASPGLLSDHALNHRHILCFKHLTFD